MPAPAPRDVILRGTHRTVRLGAETLRLLKGSWSVGCLFEALYSRSRIRCTGLDRRGFTYQQSRANPTACRRCSQVAAAGRHPPDRPLQQPPLTGGNVRATAVCVSISGSGRGVWVSAAAHPVQERAAPPAQHGRVGGRVAAAVCRQPRVALLRRDDAVRHLARCTVHDHIDCRCMMIHSMATCRLVCLNNIELFVCVCTSRRRANQLAKRPQSPCARTWYRAIASTVSRVNSG